MWTGGPLISECLIVNSPTDASSGVVSRLSPQVETPGGDPRWRPPALDQDV